MHVLGLTIPHPARAATLTLVMAVSVVFIALYSSSLLIHNVALDKPTDNPSQGSNLQVSQPIDESLTRSNLLRDLNAERQRRGLSVLTEDPRLDRTASLKASELASDGFSANPHINPRTGQHGFQYAIAAAGCSTASEDISNQNTTSNAVVNAWVNSPAHLASITGNYSTTGVSINGSIVVLHLCAY